MSSLPPSVFLILRSIPSVEQILKTVKQIMKYKLHVYKFSRISLVGGGALRAVRDLTNGAGAFIVEFCFVGT